MSDNILIKTILYYSNHTIFLLFYQLISKKWLWNLAEWWTKIWKY